jgi:hypothetical protein
MAEDGSVLVVAAHRAKASAYSWDVTAPSPS